MAESPTDRTTELLAPVAVWVLRTLAATSRARASRELARLRYGRPSSGHFNTLTGVLHHLAACGLAEPRDRGTRGQTRWQLTPCGVRRARLEEDRGR